MKALRTALIAWREIPRNVRALALTSLLRDVASEMLVHLLPLYLADVLAVQTAVIGLIEGIGETTASITKIYSGWVSDRLGRKGPTVAGYSLAALAIPVLYVANSGLGVGLARFLDRLGKGIRTAPRDALIADSVASDKRGIGFGLHRAADTAGAFLGLIAAIAIVLSLQEPGAFLDGPTFRTVVAWASIPALLAVAVVLVGVREVARRRPSELPQLSVAGLGAAFQRNLVVTVLFTLGNSTDAFLALRARSLGASVVTILAMIALFNLVYAAAAGPLGALSDRMDRRHLIATGWLLYAVVYLGFAASGSAWHLWALFALYGIYYALTEGVGRAFVADLVPEDRRGTAYGVYAAAIGLTALPASVVAGVLWQGVGAWGGLGPTAPFFFGASLALLAGVLLQRWVL